jgi:hypothetical protein
MDDSQCVLLVAKVNVSVAFAKIATVYFEPWNLKGTLLEMLLILFVLIENSSQDHSRS